MHILPIILSVWSYKNSITERYLNSLQRVAITGDGDVTPRLAVSSDGSLFLASGSRGLMAPDEVAAIRDRRRAASVPWGPDPNGSNEMIGSHFVSNEITHDGTDAWEELKHRLAENGVVIQDDDVSAMSAGLFAERKVQEILGRTDKQALRDEAFSDVLDKEGNMLYSAAWVRRMESLPDRDAIAEECYADLQHRFPKALGSDVVRHERAIGFDPKTIEVE